MEDEAVVQALQAEQPVADVVLAEQAAETGSVGRASKASSKCAAKKKNQKTSRCPGCSKSLPVESFPMNARFCHNCKLIRDRLYKSCAKSGDSDWLSKHMSSDSSIKKLFDHYRTKCPGGGYVQPQPPALYSGDTNPTHTHSLNNNKFFNLGLHLLSSNVLAGMKPQKFVLHYKEVLRVEAATDVVRLGTMLTEAAFLRHCQSPEGMLASALLSSSTRQHLGERDSGFKAEQKRDAHWERKSLGDRVGGYQGLGNSLFITLAGMEMFGLLSSDQAKAKFLELVNAEDAIIDRDGPRGALQVRVPIGKQVNFRDSEIKAKELEAEKKRYRNPTEEIMNKLELDARTNVDGVLGTKRC
eukprot:6491404-Amphidinium_carterae.3